MGIRPQKSPLPTHPLEADDHVESPLDSVTEDTSGVLLSSPEGGAALCPLL